MSYEMVTGNVQEEGLTVQAPFVRKELGQLGFQPVGFLRVPPLLGRPSQVVEILRSPYRESFGVIELFEGKTQFSLRTLLADGTVLETGAPSQGYHQYLFGPLRANYPQINYYLEGISGVSLKEMWDRHRRRVHHWAFEKGTQILPQDSLHLYMTLSRRGDLIYRVFRPLFVLSLLIGIFFFFLLPIKNLGPLLMLVLLPGLVFWQGWIIHKIIKALSFPGPWAPGKIQTGTL